MRRAPVRRLMEHDEIEEGEEEVKVLEKASEIEETRICDVSTNESI